MVSMVSSTPSRGDSNTISRKKRANKNDQLKATVIII